MGNLRFRFSDMMPNAWFYKLKYMAAAAADHRTTPSQPRRSGRKLQSSKPCQPNDLHSHSRKSYYFTRDLNSTHQKLLDSPSKLQPISSPRRRKSSNQRPNRRTTATGPRPSPELVPSVSAGCSCRANWAKPDSPSAADVKYSASVSETDSDSLPTEIRSDCSLVTDSFDKMVSSWSSNSCSCPRESVDSGGNDIVLDVDKPARQVFDEMLDRNLAPILTKTASFDDRIEGIRRKETGAEEPTRKQRSNSLIKKQSCANSPGIKLRVKSPRIGYMRVQGSGRNSASSSSTKSSSSSSSTSRSSTTTTSSTSGRVSGCMAVVKCSSDPEMDFMESMVEMIVENKINGSKELEDLLACYLCLNSDEYHDVIIKVFREIWFDYLNNSSRSK